MDWTGNRSHERFRFVRCEWPSLREVGDYGNVTGGSAEFSALSSVKSTCSFDFDGGEPPSAVDAVRVWYEFTDDDGEQARVAIGTWLPTYTEVAYTNTRDGLRASGTVEGSSMLSVLSDHLLGTAMTVPQGSQTLAEVASIIGAHQLQYIADQSAHTLPGSHTFEPDDSWLTVVNWLLSSAGFESADCDPYGRVILRKVGDRASAWTFDSGSRSIMLPRVTASDDYMRTANAVRVYYEDDTVGIAAWAINRSHGSTSTEARGGREKTLYEGVDDIAGTTDAEVGQALEAYARQKLIDNSGEILHLEWSHAFVPISCGDTVRNTYGGLDLTLSTTNMAVGFEPSAPCTTKGRTFLTTAFLDAELETGYEVKWGSVNG